MIGGEPKKENNEDEKDEAAKLAWSQLVERGIGSFEDPGGYLIGTIRGENGLSADVRFSKLEDFLGGGYSIYVNDINSGTFRKPDTDLEVSTIIKLARDLKNKGVDIKRVGIQASSGDHERLQKLIDTELEEDKK